MNDSSPNPPRGLKVNYLRSWLAMTVTMLAICFLLNMVMGMPRAGLPRVLTHYVGASAGLMSLATLLFFGVGKCVTDLIAGWMSDCGPGGRKGVVLIGAGLTAVGCLCIYFSVPGDVGSDELEALGTAYEAGAARERPMLWSAFLLIALGQFLNGLGSGFQNLGMMVAMQDLGGSSRRGLAGGLMEAALYWGVTAGTFLGGWIVALTGQLLLPFLVMAIIAVFCLFAAGVGTVDTREAILRPAGFTPQPLRWQAYRLALSDGTLQIVYFAGLMSKWVDSMIIVMSSLYLKHLGYSVADTAVIQTGFVLSWSTLSLFTGALSDFVGRKTLIWFGMLWNGVFTLAFMSFSQEGNLPLEIALTLLLGFGTGFYYGLPPAIVADIAPVHYRSAYISLYRFWRDMGNIVAPLVFAGIYQIWGQTLVAAERIMLVSAVLLMAGAVIAALFMRETCPEASALTRAE